ncbi:MAG: Enoyl-CoA hydratase [Candidatus Magnetoglobus multicellularis str. Araruama]|uniref:Enoyl-CoA hydratase n=1 Tax=Candidatus Magnetoglobus multicellularis str. Araruama TaxID=890399 RepID=A0A1V1P0S0_9BACT|nr:MAG: Enoyl-CoA hydratase [Candidatus Magnetoglobus multicellularis str. Araruama]
MEIKQSFQDLSDDSNVRVVVIKANGKHFTTGLDLIAAANMFANAMNDKEKFRDIIIELQESMNAVEKCKKPVIAAAHGMCIGAGIDLLSACDIRIAEKNTTFSIRETKIAIVADLGTLQRLPHIIGYGWFNELALTGRDFSADDALKMGFITHVCDGEAALLEQANSIATEIAENSPQTVQNIKDVIVYSRDNGIYPGMAYVSQKMRHCCHHQIFKRQ